MDISQSFEVLETAEERAAREDRLRAAEIACRFAAIDRERIRPLAAIAAGTATSEDMSRLTILEQEAQALRTELAEIIAKDIT